MRNKIILIVIVVLINACSGVNSDKNNIDTSVPLMSNKSDVNFDEPTKVFDSIFTQTHKIKLKAQGNYLNSVNSVKISKQKIFIVDSYKAKKVLVYDFEGNLLAQIGGQGQAPGQYTQPTMLTILNNSQVAVFDNMTSYFSIYDSKFVFIKKISHKEKLGFFNPQWGEIIDNKLICFSPRYDDNGKSIFLFDNDLNYLNSFMDDEKLSEWFNVGGTKSIAVDSEGTFGNLKSFLQLLISLILMGS